MRLGLSRGGRFQGAGALAAILGVGLILVGCVPGAGSVGRPGDAPERAPAAGPKTLRLGMETGYEPNDGIIEFNEAATTGREHRNVFHAGLTVYDAGGTLLPRVAQKVPRVQDGDWKVLPDGQMEITWKLRPNVKWHDGVPATAGDFAFGLQVVQDPDFPLARNDSARLITEVATPDHSTLIVRWKQTHVYGNVSEAMDIPALPRHSMGGLYERGDKQAFFNSPLWRTEFVGLGPYRLTEWVGGTRIEGLAFDDYFLGRPKIDRVIFQYVGDANVLLATVLSGAVDVVPTGGFEIPILMQVKEAWEPSGAGTAFAIAARARTYSFQFRDSELPWARDVRVRRALVHMLDRQALTDGLMGGMVTVADTLVAPSDPVYRLLEQRGLARYSFDLAQAERLMADAGWTRAPGGAYRSAAGEPFTIDITYSSSPANATEAQAVAGQWKAAGLGEVTLTGIPTTAPTAVRDEARHSSRGVAAFPRGGADLLQALKEFTTGEIGTPENRYRTGNRGGYSSPEYDRLYERGSVTLDDVQRQALWADMLKLFADDVGTIVGFYDSSRATTAFRRGIRGPGPTSGLQVQVTWNVHEWEID